MDFWKNNRFSLTWLWGVLAGVGCFLVGLAQGQFHIIWQKAVMICLECIGIG
ncbi:MAG: hypothetical protein HFI13_01275 [Lachnospiraceae bacterium]|jgi:hypothetical protein|nr:hypothetical protein [Lachnospiraceae bacterium]MCI9659326.1 hypothetical protein [Lachnospiraceae bacterium]